MEQNKQTNLYKRFKKDRTAQNRKGTFELSAFLVKLTRLDR